MKQEDKDLLLKDISARVPYGVKVECKWKTPAPNGTYGMICKLDSFLLDQIYNMNDSDVPFDVFKPYLFPMSYIDDNEKLFAEYITTLTYDSNTHSAVPTIKTFDFYNRYHIDYRGLIEKGIALDVTNENIY